MLMAAKSFLLFSVIKQRTSVSARFLANHCQTKPENAERERKTSTKFLFFRFVAPILATWIRFGGPFNSGGYALFLLLFF